MKKNIDRHTIEQLKVQLQHAMQDVLTETTLDEVDAQIIRRAMTYIVTSHNSFAEQFYRIKEYLLIMDVLLIKYKLLIPYQKSISDNPIKPLIPETKSPF